VFEVHVSSRSVTPFEGLVGVERVRALERTASDVHRMIGRRAVWNINSTAAGGGVAEMLRSLLRYARSLAIDVRWLVVEGPPDFFRVTKRVHNALHGFAGDGSPLGPEQKALFDQVTRENATAIDALIRPGDIVICHDPQTAGLVPHLMSRGALVTWRCHIGYEEHDGEVDLGWAFLRPYLEDVPFAVFSRAAYAPSWLRGRRTHVLPPTIDPFSTKNRPLGEATVRAILQSVGLVEGSASRSAAVFTRDDGSVGRVDRSVDVVRLGRPPGWSAPLVVVVSRWDAMKDPVGVLEGFARLEPEAPRGAQLVIAGPNVHAVADDPEGEKVFADLERVWRALPDSVRRCVHLALLPMVDNEENAAIVNALQSHAAIIVQKSLREGFGLTVTEAMWKGRPIVASAVGGIPDQIRDGVDGLLTRDPADLDEFAILLRRVLGDEALAARLGASARERAGQHYLSVAALENWANLVRQLLSLTASFAAPWRV
jgi:trehalose synthase